MSSTWAHSASFQRDCSGDYLPGWLGGCMATTESATEGTWSWENHMPVGGRPSSRPDRGQLHSGSGR